jgi:hypothetical protein
MMGSVIVAPINTEEQLNLVQNGDEDARLFEHYNIRALQRKLRRRCKENSSPLGEPYAKWDFLVRDRSANTFAQRLVTEAELESLADHIGQDLSTDNILQSIVAAEKRAILLQSWEDKPHSDDKWSHFPPKAQIVIRDIEKNEQNYKWERQFLGVLVDPGSYYFLMSSWSHARFSCSRVCTFYFC